MRVFASYVAVLILAGLAGSADKAAAQGMSEPSILSPGRRVRVSASAPPLTHMVATIDSVAGDTVMLREDGRGSVIAVPVGALTRLAVSRGPGSRLEHALIDGAIGGLIGGVFLGGAGYLAEERPCRSGSDVCGLATALGVVVGAGAGAVIGLAIGVTHPGERWDDVQLPVRVGITPFDHQSALTLSAAF